MRSGKREELDPDGGHREGARDCQALSPWFAWEAHAERPRSGVPTTPSKSRWSARLKASIRPRSLRC